jgi:hypothetical protein
MPVNSVLKALGSKLFGDELSYYLRYASNLKALLVSRYA